MELIIHYAGLFVGGIATLSFILCIFLFIVLVGSLLIDVYYDEY